MEKELQDIADKIRKGYASTLEDEEEEKLSFLDELNSLVRVILKDDPVDIYTLLTEAELKKWKKAEFKRRLLRIVRAIKFSKTFYFIFLATIVGFLVTEAVPFYAIGGAITSKSWLKACLTELSFIFLSGYRSSGRLELILTSFLRIATFGLMLFVITSETTLEGTKNISKIDNIQNRIELLQEQIKKTEVDIKRYREINWPRNMTQSIRKREKLEEQLIELKSRQEKEAASAEISDLVLYKMWGRALFRVILMFIVVLITRRVFRF